jgi:hypothetical protein
VKSLKIAIFLIGLFGIFSQAFSGYIIPGILAASLSSIAIAVFGLVFGSKIKLNVLATISLSIVAAVGSAYDVFDYYSHPHAVGNYYGAWFWSVPLCICLAIYIKQLLKLRANQSQP